MEIEPSLDCIDHQYEVSFQVYTSEHLGQWVVLQDSPRDIAEAKPERTLIICVQPKDCRVLLLVLSDVFDSQLSLSYASQAVKDDCRSATVAVKQLVYLQQLLLSGHKLCGFRKRTEIKWNGVLPHVDPYATQRRRFITYAHAGVYLYLRCGSPAPSAETSVLFPLRS